MIADPFNDPVGPLSMLPLLMYVELTDFVVISGCSSLCCAPKVQELLVALYGYTFDVWCFQEGTLAKTRDAETDGAEGWAGGWKGESEVVCDIQIPSKDGKV